MSKKFSLAAPRSLKSRVDISQREFAHQDTGITMIKSVLQKSIRKSGKLGPARSAMRRMDHLRGETIISAENPTEVIAPKTPENEQIIQESFKHFLELQRHSYQEETFCNILRRKMKYLTENEWHYHKEKQLLNYLLTSGETPIELSRNKVLSKNLLTLDKKHSAIFRQSDVLKDTLLNLDPFKTDSINNLNDKSHDFAVGQNFVCPKKDYLGSPKKEPTKLNRTDPGHYFRIGRNSIDGEKTGRSVGLGSGKR